MVPGTGTGTKAVPLWVPGTAIGTEVVPLWVPGTAIGTEVVPLWVPGTATGTEVVPLWVPGRNRDRMIHILIPVFSDIYQVCGIRPHLGCQSTTTGTKRSQLGSRALGIIYGKLLVR